MLSIQFLVAYIMLERPLRMALRLARRRREIAVMNGAFNSEASVVVVSHTFMVFMRIQEGRSEIKLFKTSSPRSRAFYDEAINASFYGSVLAWGRKNPLNVHFRSIRVMELETTVVFVPL